MEEDVSFQDVYRRYYRDESDSYYYNEKTDEADLNNWYQKNMLNVGAIEFWQDVLDKKIKIKKKPATGIFGWFMESSNEENIGYTFDLYKEKRDELSGRGKNAMRNRMIQKLKQDEEIKKYKIEYFREKNRDIINIHNNLIGQFSGVTERGREILPEYDPLIDNSDFLEIRKKFATEEEARNYLIQKSKEYYNEINKYYNNKVRNFKYLSPEDKNDLKKQEKIIDEILTKLKPLLSKQGKVEPKIPEEKKPPSQLNEMKNLEDKITSKNLILEESEDKLLYQKQRLDIANKKIDDLKKKKAEIKYKISQLENQVKRNVDSKKLEIKKKIYSLNEVVKKIDAEISSLDAIRRKIGRIPEKYVYDKDFAEDRLMMVNAKYMDMVSKRIIFYEKLRYEIKILRKERLDAAENVYQQEKLIADKKISEADRRNKVANQLISDEKEKIENLKSQISFQQSAAGEKLKRLDDVKTEIKKGKEVEAERQQLSLEILNRDIEELNIRKNVYDNILKANKDYSEKMKNEMAIRQTEIEKLIALDTENERLKYAEKRSDVAIQKSVFETLEEVKEKVVTEENRLKDVKKTLSDISDDIIAREAAYNILNESITKIENNELADAKIENKILEQEIILTQKLTDETLTKSERVDLLVEEKEDIIDKLEHLKSLALKKIYETRKETLEIEARKTLTLSSEEIKNKIFSLKYDIKRLREKKSISEDKEDFLNLQINYQKKELVARKKEIDLLKQIEETTKRKERAEVRQTISSIIHRIEEENITRDVQEKLDEILDDVEDEDYDYLEDDDIDTLISNVRKHISGEKKMSIDEISNLTKKERENKMAEDIEMRDRSRVEKYQDNYEEGETSFAEWNSYSTNIFVDKIEDPEMRAKVHSIFAEMDTENDEEKMKESYKTVINNALWEDDLDYTMWDNLILPEEKEKFAYERTINNINTALADSDIFLDPNDPKIKNFIDNNISESLTAKRKEVNGYNYLGKQIIGRTVARVFYLKSSIESTRFIEKLKEELGSSVRTKLAAESSMGGENVKYVAKEYITELRNEQFDLIDNVRTPKDMKNAQEEVNEIEKEIKDIKTNASGKFKIRLNVFRRTISYKITKLLRRLWKAKARNKVAVAGFLIAVISAVFGFWGTNAIIHNLKKAATSVKHYSDKVQNTGKNIIRTFQGIYRVPGTMVGYIMIGLGIFLKVLYWATRITGASGSGALFGAFGVTIEAMIVFENNLMTVNEKVADTVEETGNIIQDFGIRAEKRVMKSMKRWYFEKPTEEKSTLEQIESGAAKMALALTRGVQYTGQKVESAGEAIHNTLWYLRLTIASLIIITLIKWIRD